MTHGGRLAVLCRDRWSILLAGLLGLLLAAAILHAIPPRFIARATLFIPPPSYARAEVRARSPQDAGQTSVPTELLVPEPERPPDASSVASLTAWHAAVLTSEVVLRRVVERERLDQDPEFVRRYPVLTRIDELIRGPSVTWDATTTAVQTLAQDITVGRADTPMVLTVEARSTSSKKAVRLRDALLDVYRAQVRPTAKPDALPPVATPQDTRLSDIKAKIEIVDALVKEIQASNPVVRVDSPPPSDPPKDPPQSASAPPTAPATGTTAEPTREVTDARDAPSDPLPATVTSRLLQRLQERYAIVAQDEAALASQLRARHPDLKAIRAQRAALQVQIDRESRRIAARNAQLREAARDRETRRALQKAEAEKAQAEKARAEKVQAERAQAERLQAESARPPTVPLDLGELERELAALRKLIDEADTQAAPRPKDARPSPPNVRVVTSPAVPRNVETSTRLWILSLGLLAGLGFGVGRALIDDSRQRSLRNSTNFSHFLGAPTRAQLPRLKRPRLIDRVREWTGRSSAHTRSPQRFHRVLGALQDPPNESAGRYRQAVLRLLGTLVVTSPHKRAPIILIASARSGAGASSTALTLACAASEADERVLLVDATSLNGDLSAAFARAPNPDTLVVLDNPDSLSRITTRAPHFGFTLLPVALTDLRRLRPSQRQRLADGLTALAKSFDRIFIDAGALLEDQSVSTLLPIADEILVVARSGATTKVEMLALEQALAPHAGRPHGLVMNAAPGSA